MWIETRGRQHLVYWRTGLPSPQKAFEPFPSRDAAELFIDLARRSGTLQGALAYVRDPQPQGLRQLLGMAPLPEAARRAQPCPAHSRRRVPCDDRGRCRRLGSVGDVAADPQPPRPPQAAVAVATSEVRRTSPATW